MGKPLQAANNQHFIAFPDLGLSPVALHIWRFDLRWYSLAYLAGIFVGYWYLLKLLKQPGAPLARRHADDLVFYAALGIILGGRLGYVLFYDLADYLRHPIEILKLWDGGMSFHGGVIGTSLGIHEGDAITHANMTDDVPVVRQLPDDLATPPPARRV